ncbi:prepilin-type N-terminal cleavage/methylation domain-containing protein [Shewanella schlegeliana]|uniref:Prepilin-type N-terminal cleavage/methylation domain-containing protein n=2 Tax=Shewanella schlegeliana TaxID=190308 RepID=A0ABS1SXK4_9GAMM|nr:prepilin-type N-terminal cleavage/methylation domain-containing protein [Shewanella schlegeliana]MBL4913278.1 prepilin-type N-terminal cleavage/methylation domain-containing protein [Shewanella schlegeliana]MCL1109233.1 prepilin-type N-terminal cleavage/methylation domain-containing protein [Shewanella schlegeliana]
MTLISTGKRGFTLIEMVVVIIVLGILAVIALPKFVDLKTDTKVATLDGIAAAMKSGLDLVHSKAVIEGESNGFGSIVHAGVSIPLYNGYPAVDGNDSFDELNRQVRAWLDIDSVSLTTIQQDPHAAPFFIDKSTANNHIYIFFSEDLNDKSVSFNCHIRYENPIGSTQPVITVKHSDC